MSLDPHRRQRRRVVVALLVAWAVFVGLSLASARRDLEAGRRAAERARTALSQGGFTGGGAERELGVAARSFRRAENRIRHPALLPLQLVPVVGRQLSSAKALAGAAAQVTTTGATTARELASVLADPPASGPQRLVALDQVSTSIGRAERALRVVPLGPREGLVPPLADARQELGREVRTTQDSLRRAAVVTTGLADLLHGPRRYLLLATNNAEMRAGSGMILSAGVLTVAGGEFALDEMRPAAELELPPGGVPVEGDHAARWGWAHPGREWRNLAMTPRFDVTGPLAARMWEASTGQPVDGVVAVDIVALRAILAATGPVRVAGGLQIGADNVERHLFHDQYEGLAYDKTLEAAQAARRDHLGEIARGAVAAIQGGEADLSKLSSELPRAAAGRHALLWSRRDREQRAWEAAGVSGKVAANSVLPAVLNRAGNKLDQHLEMEAEITASARPDGIRHVTVTLRVMNNTPEGGWPYIVGPHPAIDIVEGTYLGLVALTVPGAATDLSFGPGVTTNVIGPDGPSRVVATEVRLGRGEQRSLEASFILPASVAELTIEPSARIPPVQWRGRDERWLDDRPRIFRLLR